MTTINTTVSTLVNDLLAAERAVKEAEELRELAKAKIVAFHQATVGTIPIENDAAKVAVYSVGGSYLNPSKVKEVFQTAFGATWEAVFQGCHSAKRETTNVRLTLKL